MAQRQSSRQNYIARMDLKKQRKLDAGLVSNLFPEVDGIVIHMTYLRKGYNPVIMQRTVNVFPTTYAYFNMDCMMRGCTDGGFDLTPIITEMVREHKKLKKGKLACSGENADPVSDHTSIAYEVTIKFNKGASKTL